MTEDQLNAVEHLLTQSDAGDIVTQLGVPPSTMREVFALARAEIETRYLARQLRSKWESFFPCSNCGGCGGERGADPAFDPCTECNGKGIVP